MSPKHRVIVDCDNTWGIPGLPIDDGQTLIYLAGRSDIEIVGITCTHGNGSVDQVFDATKWLVGALGLGALPVLKGASGQGDLDTEAAAWLSRKADEEPGKMELLAIGTMTNLLGAKTKDPAFFAKLSGIAAMGGYLHPLPVRGWNKIGEVNLSRDSAATAALLRAECPVTVMSAQICLQAPFGIDELAPIAANDRASYFYMLSYLMGMIRRHAGAQEYLWDLLPAVFLSHPELFHRNAVRISTDPAILAKGILSPDAKGSQIDLPDYIIDIDSFYEILYAAWEKAPLSFG
ncbi:MAG: nucleoside hydrolase [Spirochaetota bacterium]